MSLDSTIRKRPPSFSEQITELDPLKKRARETNDATTLKKTETVAKNIKKKIKESDESSPLNLEQSDELEKPKKRIKPVHSETEERNTETATHAKIQETFIFANVTAIFFTVIQPTFSLLNKVLIDTPDRKTIEPILPPKLLTQKQPTIYDIPPDESEDFPIIGTPQPQSNSLPLKDDDLDLSAFDEDSDDYRPSIPGEVENLYAIEELKTLKTDYPQLRNIDTLPTEISHWRPIRGDGNCYYRACMFGLIEQIIASSDRVERFLDLAATFKTITKSLAKEHQTGHLTFIKNLEKAAKGKKWIDIEEFEEDITNADGETGLDESMIRASRYLTADWLLKNPDHLLPFGLTVSEVITPTYGSIEDYCENFIKKMNAYTEGIPVQIGLLGQILNFNLTSYLIPSIDNTTIQRFSNETPRNERVVLLNVGVEDSAHYVLAYPKKRSSKR